MIKRSNFIYSLYFRGAFISGNTTTKVSVANLTSIPRFRFLRFNEVELFDNGDSKSCRFENYLQPLKEALKDSISIQFVGFIDRNNPKDFGDHLKLLEYLSEHFLKICNSSRGYTFSIYLRNEEAEAKTNVLKSIIQMPQICRCSTLRINLCCIPQHVLLPVEAISSWLNRSIGDGMNFIGRRTPKEIFLKIHASSIQNVVEMCDHLVEVCLFYKVQKMFIFTVFYIFGKIYFACK